MSILWVLSSDIWLWVFLRFSLDHFVIKVKREVVIILIISISIFIVYPIVSPVVVKVGREGAIRMSILRILASNVWLRIFLVLRLSSNEVIVSPVIGPIVVVEA